jgi:hypothetical protein
MVQIWPAESGGKSWLKEISRGSERADETATDEKTGDESPLSPEYQLFSESNIPRQRGGHPNCTTY